jgi:vacuolar protein sorting-associated protein 35
MVGTLLALRSISKEDYESLITKTAQFSAKVMKKPDQCQLVALCAHLFYPASHGDNMKYSNPQRALECLQRSLKLADACTSANPSNVGLFVDLLEHYVYFFEKKNPMIKDGYITGLIALIKEHVSNLGSFGGDSSAVSDSKAQFLEVVRYIKRKKAEDTTAELFASIQVDNVGA